MKQVHNSIDLDLLTSNSLTLIKIRKFIIKPIFIGLFVFSMFFSTILLTKVSAYLIVENSILDLNVNDVLFSVIGFAIGFSIEIILQIKSLLNK